MVFHTHTEKFFVDTNDETKTVSYCVTCYEPILESEVESEVVDIKK